MPRYTLKSLLLAVTFVGLTIGFVRGCFLALTHFETAENVPHVSWLPQSASNISYYRSYLDTAYEFDMSEAEFRKWTWLDVKPITSPFTIRRYNDRTAIRPELGPNPTWAELEAWDAIGKATISRGLYYSERRGNGGGVHVAFDRDQERVYFQTNHH